MLEKSSLSFSQRRRNGVRFTYLENGVENGVRFT